MQITIRFLQGLPPEDPDIVSGTLWKLLQLEDTVQLTVEEHQCSLDHYQLLLQTIGQELEIITEGLGETQNLPGEPGGLETDHLAIILNILQV